MSQGKCEGLVLQKSPQPRSGRLSSLEALMEVLGPWDASSDSTSDFFPSGHTDAFGICYPYLVWFCFHFHWKPAQPLFPPLSAHHLA